MAANYPSGSGAGGLNMSPQAVVSVAATHDTTAISARKRALGSKRSMYPPPSSEAQGGGDKVYTVRDRTILYRTRLATAPGVSKYAAQMHQSGPSLSGDQGGSNVPVQQTVNGFLAESVEEAESMIEPFGIALQGTRYNGQDLLVAQLGGTVTYFNNDTLFHEANCPIEARLPVRDRSEFPLKADTSPYPGEVPECHRTGKGRAELIYSVFDWGRADVSNPLRLIEILNRVNGGTVSNQEKSVLIQLAGFLNQLGVFNDAQLATSRLNEPTFGDKAAIDASVAKLDEDDVQLAYTSAIRGIMAWIRESTHLLVGLNLTATGPGQKGVLKVGSYML